jgi:hypothetical protein
MGAGARKSIPLHAAFLFVCRYVAMTDANKANNRRQQAYAFTIEDKVWLIDLAERNPALETVDRHLADHVNAGRGKVLVVANPPPKDPINDWKRQKDKFRGHGFYHNSVTRIQLTRNRVTAIHDVSVSAKLGQKVG